MEIYQKLCAKLGKKVLKNEPLFRHTTFQIGGPAKYYFLAKNTPELVKAVKTAYLLNLPFFVLGGGSNILVADQGFKGLAIEAKNNKVRIEEEKIFAEAGAATGYLGLKAKEVGLSGLEFLAVIPGSVGGAIRGNAGAFGQEIKDVLEEVNVLSEKGEKESLSPKTIKFGYRDSFFKHHSKIILEGTFRLKRKKVAEIEAKIKEYQKYKRDTQDLEHPSAGSIFKNPTGKSAGQIIDELGLKGYKVGGAMISQKHANFIVNAGRAKAEDVVILIGIIKQKVRTHYQGLQLEEEIQYVGF